MEPTNRRARVTRGRTSRGAVLAREDVSDPTDGPDQRGVSPGPELLPEVGQMDVHHVAHAIEAQVQTFSRSLLRQAILDHPCPHALGSHG
jgi:hypothetical protein